MRILGIETSCDETGVAIYDKYHGLLANQLYSQGKLHLAYGGVVPELAARDHMSKIIPLIKSAMQQAKLTAANIDGIAYTAGPGLMGALLVGATVSHALAYAWQVPVIGINHMEGHLLTPMLEHNMPSFPFVALLVSGGHTQLIAVYGISDYQLLGESLDDAAGEAFDKIAQLLGLDYPGGHQLSMLAQHGKVGRYTLPRPMTEQPGLSFSFSGLKTSAAKIIRAATDDLQTRADIARAFEDAIVETLIIKCRRALVLTGFNQLVIAGGVSANQTLRIRMNEVMHQYGGTVSYASPEFCTDNGAMIAYTGMIKLQGSTVNIKDNLSIIVRPHWPIEELVL